MPTALFTRGYLVDLATMDRLEFDYNPDNINDNKDADYASDTIPGASHVRVSYSNGGNRVLTFDLRIVREDIQEAIDIVKTKCEWLQSLEYPSEDPELDATGYDQLRPPFVQFIMGSLYDLPCIVKSVKVKWGILRQLDLLPEYADVSLTLWEVGEETVTLSQVRTGHYSNARYLPGLNPR